MKWRENVIIIMNVTDITNLTDKGRHKGEGDIHRKIHDRSKCWAHIEMALFLKENTFFCPLK